jgi:hypothetical protein
MAVFYIKETSFVYLGKRGFLVERRGRRWQCKEQIYEKALLSAVAKERSCF